MGKTILFLVNHEIVIYNFRRELVERLIAEGHRVIISSPYGKKIEKLKNIGAEHVNLKIDRHGKNIFSELKLIQYYKKTIKEINPDIIFSYTIKPNIYGAIAARKYNIPFVANITGLGTAVEQPGIMQGLTLLLYKYAFTSVKTVFFQNEENQKFFEKNNIAIAKHKLLPGSGVNLDYFKYLDYPDSENSINFIFISRIMKEKGIDLYLEAAEVIKKKYPKTTFHIIGFCEESYENKLEEYQNRGIIQYHGMQNDIREYLKKTHCTIHPTYYPEGMSNVLLESAASGRPVIATDRSGCREIVDDGITGYLIEPENGQDLIEKIKKFINLSYEEQKSMGLAGRTKVEKEFDRNIVINNYIRETGDI
ncbi:glycosyltransferase family 4 protein [Facklamia sp. P12945]|uniref:glycosyltransferase family 4 protein n=1 Tax=Facklamia sp. P12945 TaxID=3421950 RepID=UPI003D176602